MNHKVRSTITTSRRVVSLGSVSPAPSGFEAAEIEAFRWFGSGWLTFMMVDNDWSFKHVVDNDCF